MEIRVRVKCLFQEHWNRLDDGTTAERQKLLQKKWRKTEYTKSLLNNHCRPLIHTKLDLIMKWYIFVSVSMSAIFKDSTRYISKIEKPVCTQHTGCPCYSLNNSIATIYIAFAWLDMIQSTQEDVCMLHVDTMPFYAEAWTFSVFYTQRGPETVLPHIPRGKCSTLGWT